MSAFALVLGIAVILVGVLFAVFANRLITIPDVESKRTLSSVIHDGSGWLGQRVSIGWRALARQQGVQR